MQSPSRMTSLLGRCVSRRAPFWIAAGRLETALLPDLDTTPLSAPIYICGLARSGSTLLLEMLASHPDVASHRYRDFPFVFTPYLRNLLPAPRILEKTERAHGDGMLVAPDSPEAMEEMLWMGFFPGLHTPQGGKLFSAADSHPEFELFYRNHIRKLLRARGRPRYACKGNYHSGRLGYLRRLFPDARFIIPVRDPVTHVTSLMRQQARFRQAGERNPRIAEYMAMAGHFEFGPQRLPAPASDAAQVLAAWQQGDEAAGYALQWHGVYRHIHEQLEADPQLKQQALIVRFETLRANPYETVSQLFAHAQLSPVEAWADAVRKPEIGAAPLSAEETATVRHITAGTASLFGY